MTKQEKHLWYDFLQKYKEKIYKQRIIKNYIADFYCHSARLIIELDGSQHYSEEGMNKDNARTDALNKLGIDVIRYSNLEVDTNFDGVCEDIDRIINARKRMYE